MLILAIVFILVLISLVLFSFPKLSPIPYFPTQPADMPTILDTLKLQDDQIILDLGAGDGIVIFQAAKRAHKQGLHTIFFAIETNPILVLILFIRKLLSPHRNYIHIIWKDLFTINYKRLLINYNLFDKNKRITFYLYISPWLIKNAMNQVEKTIETFDVVSYFYNVPTLKNKKTIQGKNKIFVY